MAKESLELVITQEELRELEETVVRELSRDKRIKVPGFRPGKLPPQVVRQRFGDLIKREVVDRAIKQKVAEALQGKPVLGEISVTELKEENGQLVVRVEFETLPEIKLPDLSRITVEKRIITISEAEIDQHIDELRSRLATQREVDRGIIEGDHVWAEMTEFNPQGEPISTAEVYIHYARDELDPELYDALAGKKVGDVAEITVVAESERGEPEEHRQVYKILRIVETVLPEANDELAQKFGYDSLQALREALEKSIREQVERESEAEYEWAIIKAIYDAAPFEVPESLVKRRYEAIKDEVDIRDQEGNPAPPEVKEQEVMRIAEDLVKRELILNRVADEFNIEVSDEDVMREVEEDAKERGVEPKKLLKELKKKGELERYRYVARLKKALEFLKTAVKTEHLIQ